MELEPHHRMVQMSNHRAVFRLLDLVEGHSFVRQSTLSQEYHFALKISARVWWGNGEKTLGIHVGVGQLRMFAFSSSRNFKRKFSKELR